MKFLVFLLLFTPLVLSEFFHSSYMCPSGKGDCGALHCNDVNLDGTLDEESQYEDYQRICYSGKLPYLLQIDGSQACSNLMGSSSFIYVSNYIICFPKNKAPTAEEIDRLKLKYATTPYYPSSKVKNSDLGTALCFRSKEYQEWVFLGIKGLGIPQPRNTQYC